MRVNSITANINNRYFTPKSTQIIKNSANSVCEDKFISSAPKTSFKGLFGVGLKEPVTPAEKKSLKINNEINLLDIEAENAKKIAKEEMKNADHLLHVGLVTQGMSFTTSLGKKYTIDKLFEEVTFFDPLILYPTLSTETKIRKGAPIRHVKRSEGQESYRECVWEFNKNGYKYTEKVKDYEDRKLRTERKVNLVRVNGINKSTYTERNEDGSFSTYVYKGRGGLLSKKFDIYSMVDGIWEKSGEDTMNLAQRVS